MVTRTHKRKKSSRYKGRCTAGWGFRKQHRSSGNQGGDGMSGTGKRADHKKTLVTKLYGNDYFGKQGITSKSTQKDKSDRINLGSIETNLENYIKRGIAKKTANGFEINLKSYKILGDGEVKSKMIIKAKAASQSAIEKVKKLGGEIILEKAAEKKKGEK